MQSTCDRLTSHDARARVRSYPFNRVQLQRHPWVASTRMLAACATICPDALARRAQSLRMGEQRRHRLVPRARALSARSSHEPACRVAFRQRLQHQPPPPARPADSTSVHASFATTDRPAYIAAVLLMLTAGASFHSWSTFIYRPTSWHDLPTSPSFRPLAHFLD